MRGSRIPLLAAASAAAAWAQAPRTAVDPRVELLGILFRLAGNSEYRDCRVPAYTAAVDAWFGAWANHSAVNMARDLRQRDGIGYDAPMSLAVHITDVDTLGERVPFDQPGIALDSRWHGANARTFLTALRSFVSDTRFRDFLASQKPLHETAGTRLGNLAQAQLDFTWFDRFFGPRPVTAALVPALLNGSSNYGVRVVDPAGAEEVYAVLGVWQTDADGLPYFPPGQISTTVHEFAHSYANPLVDAYMSQLEAAGNRLYLAKQPAMQSQGYGNGAAVLHETLTRASSARYFAEKNGPAGCDQAVLYEQNRSFLWTGELTKLLFEYEHSRDAYPTLEAFMPRIAAFLEEASLAPASMPARYEQSRPKVVDVSIPAGASDVNPDLNQIVVRFDRPMVRSYSVLPRTPAMFPQVLGAKFDESLEVCTISVALEPERDYEFNLNATGNGWFGSAEGVALAPYTVWFRTRRANPHGIPRQAPAPTRGRLR